MKILVLAVVATLTGCSEGLVVRNTGVPLSPGSTRTTTPATVASIDKLGDIQRDCYAKPTTSTALSPDVIKSLSATGQAEYFRGQALAAMAREIRLAAGQQEADPCADTARAYYSLLTTREKGKWQAIGTGLKVFGLGLGIYATGNAIATVVGAAAAGGGARIVNIGGSRGSSGKSNPGSVPKGSAPAPSGTVSSSGNDAISLSGATINLGDKAVIGAGSGGGLAASAPIGFDQFKYLPGSGIIGNDTPQNIYQPGATTPTNNITPDNSKSTGLLN